MDAVKTVGKYQKNRETYKVEGTRTSDSIERMKIGNRDASGASGVCAIVAGVRAASRGPLLVI